MTSTPTSTPPTPPGTSPDDAPPDSDRTGRDALSAPWTRRVLWANLVAQIGIIVTGGAVRLTGSGLGCSTWPQCEPGRFTPEFHPETAAHAFIEFGNRTLTGVLGVVALAVAVMIWRQRDRATWYRRLALVPLVGVLAQAVIGGITVLASLHPAVVGLHMLVSLVLVAVSALLLVRDRREDRAEVDPTTRRLAGVLLAVGVLLMVLGVITTGAGPYGGDAQRAQRWALDPVLVARAHAWAVWVFLAVLAVCLWRLHRTGARDRLRRAWWALLGVTAAQGAVGYVQYFTGLPEVIVGVHLLGTGVLTATLTWAYSELYPWRSARS